MCKKTVFAVVAACTLFFAGCADEAPEVSNQTGQVEENVDVGEEVQKEEEPVDFNAALTSNEAIAEARAKIWEDYLAEIRADETRKAEVENLVMQYGEVSMKYGLQEKGTADENGYPLYIALHGGGSSDTPDMNDSQWSQMAMYYNKKVKNGIYVNPRGVRDTWDTHGNPESYPLYDRLIENLIAFYNVDPNRVYLLGFSAGGDGVYMITPRMTDRFAAANMSAGHPNGVNLTNLYNMPIQLQVGMLDTAYNRHTVTAEYDAVLNSLRETYGGGYDHSTFIHVQYAHNFYDNKSLKQEVIADPAAWLAAGDTTSVEVNPCAIDYVDQYTREALPERVVWDLTTRAELREVESFYWLSAGKEVNEGVIVASYNKEDNSITIEENTANGAVTVLISNDMLDVFAPITVHTETESYEVTVTPDYDLLKSTTYERGDKHYQFVGSIVIK